MNEENRSIVIATDDREKALYIFAKDALIYERIEINYIDKYAPTVEFLVRMLRVAFGWVEEERGMKKVSNDKCVYAINGFCTGPCKPKNVSERRCTTHVRNSCSHYKKKYSELMEVNFVLLEKVGQIRGL